jgi:endonuclease/exonuclease/phosphatase (EEP) superfamily protein YafD
MKRIDRVVFLGAFVLAIVAGVRALPLPDGFPWLALEAEIAWVLAPAWALIAYAAIRREKAIAVAAGIAALGHAIVISPGTTGDGDTWRGTVRVATANLYAYNARMPELARELRGLDAEVLALEELTPEWMAVLEREGVFERYPHRVAVPREDCFGIALFAHAPIVEHEVIDFSGVPLIRATVVLDGREVDVYAIHTLPPRTSAYASVWSEQMEALAARVAAADRPVILAGDLNASPYGRTYRALLAETGLRGAHEVMGRGLATTWPNGAMRIPPMRLDHVLVSREIAIAGVREGTGAGSDHRPVIAELTVREALAASR